MLNKVGFDFFFLGGVEDSLNDTKILSSQVWVGWENDFTASVYMLLGGWFAAPIFLTIPFLLGTK